MQVYVSYISDDCVPYHATRCDITKKTQSERGSYPKTKIQLFHYGIRRSGKEEEE